MQVFDIFNQYAADPNLELEGKWQDIGPSQVDADGKVLVGTAPAIRVARSGNKKHSRIVSQLYDANKLLLEQKGELSEQKGEEITIEAMSKAVLLGWRNVSFKGERIEDGYDIVTAKKLLAVPAFRELVNKYATDFQQYRLMQDAANEKN